MLRKKDSGAVSYPIVSCTRQAQGLTPTGKSGAKWQWKPSQHSGAGPALSAEHIQPTGTHSPSNEPPELELAGVGAAAAAAAVMP